MPESIFLRFKNENYEIFRNIKKSQISYQYVLMYSNDDQSHLNVKIQPNFYLGWPIPVPIPIQIPVPIPAIQDII